MRRASRELPAVTKQDLRPFEGPVAILDAEAFTEKLEAFVRARLDAATHAADREVTHVLAGKAACLRRDTRWTPGATELQRGRAIMIEALELPSNLPLNDFAALAGKSIHRVCEEIDARLLLALNLGSRGPKLPDWQLDIVKQQLTQMVLCAAGQVDEWTVYRALTQPFEGLGGRAPVEAVTAGSVEKIAGAVIDALGFQAPHARLRD